MGGGPSTQTTINKTELPEWVDEAAQRNLKLADQLAEKPYVPYTGSLTADQSELQLQANQLASNMVGSQNGVLSLSNLLAMPTQGFEDALAASTALATPGSAFFDTLGQAQSLAGISPDYTKQMSGAQNAITSGVSAGQGALNSAIGTAQGVSKYNPQMFTDADISAYMNPYIAEVENRAIDNANRAFQQNLNGISANAVSAGAFGGSRQGIAEGVAAAENARNIGDLSAQLRAQGFDTAAGLLANDLSRQDAAQALRLDAANTIGNMGATIGQLGIGAGSALGSLADAAQSQRAASAQNIANIAGMGQQANQNAAQLASSNAALGQQARQAASSQLTENAQVGNTINGQNAALLATLGQQQQQVEQQRLQEAYAKWKDEQDADLRALNLRLAAVGATPYGSTQTQQSTASGGNSGGMQILGGILGLLPFLFSDENEKTDKKRIGTDPQTGLPIYSFRYKGDPKSYPKVVGVMAQDVEKKFPELVETIPGKKGGRKAINLGFGGGF